MKRTRSSRSGRGALRLSLLLPMLLVLSMLAGPVPAASQEGDYHEGWALAEQIEKRITEPVIPARDYDVRDFGALGDGETDSRPAITAAINAANADGGGRVVLPEGTWFSVGPIHLKSNIELHVSDGATLLFTQDTNAYLPQVLTRWEGTEVFNYSPLIYGYQVSNTAITGGGTIDGNAAGGFSVWRGRQSTSQNLLRVLGAEGVPVHERVFGPGEDDRGDFLRPNMIQFFGATNVMLEGVTVTNSPMWVNHFVYSRNVIVRGVTVNSQRINNDGVVIDSSSDVLIEGNSFTTGDDCIVIKAGRDQDGWRVGRPSENIIVRNNQLGGGPGSVTGTHNALAVGSEMSGGVRNIFFDKNELVSVVSAIYFKSNPDRGGMIENVWARDISVGNAQNLLRFQTDYHSWRGEVNPVRYRNFYLENIQAENVTTGILATGHNLAPPLENVWVRDMRVEQATRPMVLRNIKGLELNDVWINGRQLPHEPLPDESDVIEFHELDHLWPHQSVDPAFSPGYLGAASYGVPHVMDQLNNFLNDVPEPMEGGTLVRAAHADRQLSAPDEYMVFDAKQDATVWLGFDPRGQDSWWPDWLDEQGFELTDHEIGVSGPGTAGMGGAYAVLAKDVTAGERVVLGPNSASTSTSAAYIAVVTAEPVTFDDVVAVVEGYFEDGLLTESLRQQLLAHLSVAQGHADHGRTAQAEQALDRFAAAAHGVADEEVRTTLLAAVEALRDQL